MFLPLVRAAALTAYKELLDLYNVDMQDVLQRLSLPPDYLNDPDRLIPVETKIDLLELGAKLSKQPDFGLQLAQRQSIAILGSVGLLAQQSATVGEALQAITEHIKYHMQKLELAFECKGDIAFFYLHCQLPKPKSVSRQHVDNIVLNAFNIVNLLCNNQLKLRAAYLEGEAPESLDPYTRLFHAPVAFSQKHSYLVFDRAYLDIPIANANPTMRRLLQSHLQQQHPEDFVSQIRWIIANLLSRQSVTLEEVADSLGIAPRTLQHRLSALSLTFQQLLDQVRIEQVCRYMSESGLSLTEISELIGFSQLSAMTRSFKRSMGVSPGEWRKQQAGKTAKHIA